MVQDYLAAPIFLSRISLMISVTQQAQYMLGSGDVYTLMEADYLAAPIFYYPFTFIMVFVVLNMTIAIIMDGYMDAHMQKKEKLQVFFFVNMTIAIIMHSYMDAHAENVALFFNT